MIIKPYFFVTLLAALYITKPQSLFGNGSVLGTLDARADSGSGEFLESDVGLNTKTSFDVKEVLEIDEIPFEIKYEEDSEREYGTEEVSQVGVLGKRENKYRITYWFDEIIDKELIKTDVVEPVDEVIAKGTKIFWRDLPSEYGDYKYWRKIRVWATKYDGNCDGCRGLTYSGTVVRKGVCAVDPKVIPMGTNFYVVGYGMCRSEDIGGGIKGNKVDLGYEDVMKGEWRTGWTDVYLLTNSPDGDGSFYD